MQKWWDVANGMLKQTALETRFSLNQEGRVVITPAVLPKDEADTRLLFEIVSDVFAKLYEDAEREELDEGSDS